MRQRKECCLDEGYIWLSERVVDGEGDRQTFLMAVKPLLFATVRELRALSRNAQAGCSPPDVHCGLFYKIQ